MSSSFAHSHYMPCVECGASVALREREAHACNPERLLDYRMFHLRSEVAGFEGDLQGFLDSPHGQFAQWLAERERRPS
jgi:hypothetical protein